ncbi:MAG: four helix bundle protein [Patescibacteria group bacterium]
MKISKFTDLEVWKEAHKLTLLVYKITTSFPKAELYGLISQLRRAAVSVESCIAEGFSRYHYKDRLRFYYDSRGSISEVQTQFLIAKDLKFVSKEEFDALWNQTEKVAIILSGLIKSTEKLANS